MQFDGLVPMDYGIQFQQSMSKLPLAVVLLQAKTNKLEDIEPLIDALLATLRRLQPRTLVRLP